MKLIHFAIAILRKSMLIDRFGRVHDYLRISLTDRCNFSCFYCKPDNRGFSSSLALMSPEEISAIAEAFVDLGIKKIRLTGGEPLARKEFPQILKLLSEFPVELTLTTNGFFIDRYINDLINASVKSINVSMDSLQPDKFRLITGSTAFKKIQGNMNALLKNNIHVKLNVVIAKNVNDNEALDFIALTENLPLHVRFIEFMPFSGNRWSLSKVVTSEDLIQKIRDRFPILKLEDKFYDTSKKYFVRGYKGTFAFISTISEPFCSGCNRLRLTADGKLKNCLFSQSEADLLKVLRMGTDIKPLIRNEVFEKYEVRGGQFQGQEKVSSSPRSMIEIGG